MCGIVGYIGTFRDPKEVLLTGLKHLEYRGYDSAGVAWLENGKTHIEKCKGKVAQLENQIKNVSIKSTIALGHTRWATHGKPSTINAHPHQVGNITVVHNGIIENYIELKKELRAQGYTFQSETDTEVIACLIKKESEKSKTLEESVQKALRKLQGSYAIVVMNELEPEKLVAAKKASPLVIGIGKKEYFLASDIPALLSFTKQVAYLDDYETAILTPHRVEFQNMKGEHISKKITTITWSAQTIEKAGFEHFMLKEIYEQPQAIIHTLSGNLSENHDKVLLPLEEAFFNNVQTIYLIACGTAWHASLIGKYLLEKFANIRAEIDLASEFRYRNPILKENDLLIVTSQSGETADSLAALQLAKERGIKTLAICNAKESSIARAADQIIYTEAGPEIGVASTKAFTTQILIFNLLSLYLAQKNKNVSKEILELTKIPSYMEQVLSQAEKIKNIASKYYQKLAALYMGRDILYPIALEGALKLKEIAYIQAHGYPAGEMKHGPIALVDQELPVIALLQNDSIFEKMMSNVEEVKAREGIVIAISQKPIKIADDNIILPLAQWHINPFLYSIPIQLFAYYMARFKGTDVDQPRNLAKSVTVE
ncbi:MAG: glutamine--fructose-6-phosphate transaminase (isomerizing) [Deltaproteobacteria bacterium]|nr:glutamine--fructose-6-phosphate transaminase (isomerizing) [Deltaproteobacteria bacterium]